MQAQRPPPPKSPAAAPPSLGHAVPAERQPSAEALRRMHRFMLESRLLEQRIVELYRQNRITGGCYSGIGNEATSVGMSFGMEPDDVLVPTHRDMGAHVVRGHSPRTILSQYFKKATSQTGGKDSGLHLGEEHSNIVGMISHLAHMMPVAVGVALAERQKGRACFVVTTIGDGATSLGDFHESLNFCAVQKLPVLFVIVNNQYAYSTPNTMQYACDKLSDRAIGYGMAGEQVDGTDVIAVHDAAMRARARGLRGEGPTLLDCITMRMRGHSEHDDHKYVPAELLERWQSWDPLRRVEARLSETAAASPEELVALGTQVGAEIDAAVEAAWAEPEPKGPEAAEDLFRTWQPGWTVDDGVRVWGDKL